MLATVTPKNLSTYTMTIIEKALFPITVYANCLGLLLSHSFQRNDKNSIFVMLAKIIYNTYCIMGAFALSTCSLVAYKRTEQLSCIYYCVYYFTSGVIMVLFVRISQKWKCIISNWSNIEKTLIFTRTNTNLGVRFKIIATSFFVIRNISYILHTVNQIKSVLLYCKQEFSSITKTLLMVFLGHIYPEIENLPSGLSLLLMFSDIIAIQTEFFCECYLVVISVGLTSFIKDLSRDFKRTFKCRGLLHCKLCEKYNKLCQLCRLIDEQLSFVIFTVIFKATHVICIGIFEILTGEMCTLNNMYFIYMLTSQTFSILIILSGISKVNDESKKLLRIIYSMPPDCYNNNIEFLMLQIVNTNVGFSPFKFFTINKEFILSWAGMILTLELIVLNFKGEMEFEISNRDYYKGFNCSF